MTGPAIQTQQDLARFPVEPGETVTAWSLSAVSACYFPGEPALAEDRVNYRFINGFVDVGDLPCRRALWKDVEKRSVTLDTSWPVESINLPGFNRRLEFSDFWHRPTRLKRWCRTILEPSETGTYPFSLATCGGVHIWVDGILAAKFEPYSRNTEQKTHIELPLKASGSEVIMLSEDLAERDTNWYVELTLQGERPIVSAVPGDADAHVVRELMAVARDVRPEREFSSSAPLVLTFDQPSADDIEVTARVLPSVHQRGKPPTLSSKAVLKAGETTLKINGIETMPDGYHPLDLVFAVGGTRVSRQIAFALLREINLPDGTGDLLQRKQHALRFAADHGEMRVGRALAILATGQGCSETCRTIIEDTLEAIDERRDCSDFVLVPLLWLQSAYRDQLPADLAARIDRSILEYRYWVDEPGNDAMWFWSENHVLCFHVSQYLAGTLLPSGYFTMSGRSGSKQRQLAEERLSKWFDSVEEHGFAEWNSAAYYPIDFIGLLALQHLGEGVIAQRAGQLLDRLFEMIALHTLAGVPSGSMGRAYDKELRAGPCTELAPFATVAFGSGWLNDGVAALPMFCAGSYEPPAQLAKLASPDTDTAVQAHYVQGYGNAAQLALYKTQSVQLSASIDNTPGARGHQQHILDVRFAGHPFARAWINHPGEDDPWGHQRPSYWAGNGSMPRVGQYGNAALMLFDIPSDHRIDFTHVYAPLDTFDAWDIHGDWLMLQSSTGFAAISACGPLAPMTEGPGQHREFRSYGRKAGWVVITGDLPAGASLPLVREMLARTQTSFDARNMTVSLQRPDAPGLTLTYETGLTVGGTPHGFPNPKLKPEISISSAVILKSNALDQI
jgi:hypothetical protein